MRSGPEAARMRLALLEFALSLPEAWEDGPWGERVVKVGKKIFVFGGQDADHPGGPGVWVKLPQSQPLALAQPGVSLAGYGLGRAGWVDVRLMETELPLDAFRHWVLESYRAVAPKRLAATLDSAVPVTAT